MSIHFLRPEPPSEAPLRVLRASEIVVLRPWRFVGDTADGTGLHRLVCGAIDHAFGQALAGRCRRIDVVLHPDGSVSVTDDGAGLPTHVDADDPAGRRVAEVLLTSLPPDPRIRVAMPKAKQAGPCMSVDLFVVNCLSDWLTLAIHSEGRLHRMAFRRGEALAPLADAGATRQHGTELRFMPSQEVFGAIRYDAARLARYIRRAPFVHCPVTVTLADRRDGRSDVITRSVPAKQ